MLVFDAHLRDSFMELRLSPLLAAIDSKLVKRALVVGSKGFCKKEFDQGHNGEESLLGRS